MKQLLSAVLLAGIGASAIMAQSGERTTVRTLHFLLSPSKETPAISTTGKGAGQIEIVARRDADNRILSAYVDFRIDYYLAEAATLTGLHIHRGAEGTAGPVVINSGLRATPVAAGNGSLFYQVELTAPAQLEVVAAVMSNPAGYYVNLHSQAFPGGVMRGQLINGPASAESVSDLSGKIDGLSAKVDAQKGSLDTVMGMLRRLGFRLGISLE